MTERLVLGILLCVLGGALSNCGQSPATPTPVPTQSLSPFFTAAPPSTRPASVLADATLFGSVYEVVSDAPRRTAGIEGVSVYCEQCGGATHTYAFTDSTGSYVFPPGVWTEGRPDFPVRLWISRKGYKDPAGLP